MTAYFSKRSACSATTATTLKNFAYDTPTKKIARTMILDGRRSVDADWIARASTSRLSRTTPSPAPVGCETCHRGGRCIPVAVQHRARPVSGLAGQVDAAGRLRP